MAPLHVLVCLMGLVALSNSQCFFKENVVKDGNNSMTGCVDIDGQQHDFESEWVRDCMDCSCTKEGLSCCSMLPDPDTVDLPDGCELFVNNTTCSAKMVLKSDKTKDCDPV